MMGIYVSTQQTQAKKSHIDTALTHQSLVYTAKESFTIFFTIFADLL